MQLQTPSRRTVKVDACGFALVAIVVAVFSPLLTCNFTSWDDLNTIVHNYHLSEPVSFWSHGYMDLYVPITYMAWSLLHAISSSAWVFHLANITVHALSAVLVYKIAMDLKAHGFAMGTHGRAVGFGSLIGALFFALHPVQVETVAWCSGLKDVLCGFFVLVTIFLYLRNKYWLATLSLILGILSKPTAIVAPLMVLTIDTLLLQRTVLVSLKRLALWFILIIPCLWWTHIFQAPASEHPQLLLRPMIALDAISFYIWKIVWPIDLCVDYGRNPAQVISSGAIYYTWIVLLAVICVGCLILRQRSRKQNPVATNASSRAPIDTHGLTSVAKKSCVGYALLFVIPLLPVLGLVPFDFQTYSTTADHYVYLSLASVGLALAALRPPRWVAIILVPLGVLSIFQMGYWRDTTTLFEHALAVNPRSYVACDSLAAEAVEKQDFIAVESFSNRALAINPRDVTARVHLADALAKKGDLNGALRLLRQAKEIERDSAQVTVNLAGLLAQMNDPSAEQQLRRAVQLAPEEESAWLNLGTYLVAKDKPEAALPYLQKAVAMRPDDPQARTNLGIAFASMGRNAEAVAQLREALRIDPKYGPAIETLRSIGR